MSTTEQATGVVAAREQDLLQSGGFGRSTNSARAGFLPVCLESVPIESLEGLSLYLRVRAEDIGTTADGEAGSGFRLYSADNAHFAELHRKRLLDHKVRFVYIRMADQSRFRRQTEKHLQKAASDPAIAISERSAIVYETSVELMNELLAEPDLIASSPRLEHISRAITTLVINNPSSFSHLFAASHHDFYTATHMVNVATWMVPLAYELGIHDADELNHICQAGMLHDMGKTQVPEEVLNKPGKLSPEDWAQIKRHPVAGCEYLEQFGKIHPLVLTVTRQHHERLDGTGYPDGLKDDQIHLVSRICALVDSFDAMTAFRPFKERTLSVEEAMKILEKETPSKYDPLVLKAWIRLMRRVLPARLTQENTGTVAAPGTPITQGRPTRRHERKAFHCSGRAHVLETAKDGANTELPGVPIEAHSISRSGLGFMCQTAIPPGTFARVYVRLPGWEKRPLEGQTVRCRTHNDSWHEIGMQFTTVEAETTGAVPPMAT